MLFSLHHDLSAGILNAQLGLTLGDQFQIYNAYFPPIEKAWYSLALKISALSGVDTVSVFLLQTCVAVSISSILAFQIRRQTTGATARFFCLSILILLLIPILFKNIIGIREHLVVLGMWPYLVLRAAGDNSKNIGIGLRITLGLWMGFTLLFKYLCSIFIMFVELVDAVSHRRISHLFRIENLLSAVVVFIYLYLWLGVDPAQREAFSAVRESIAGNLISTVDSIKRADYWAFASVVMILLSLIFKAEKRLIAIGVAFVLGAVAVSWIQGRWYTHHLFPIFMALIGWWWMVGDRFNKWAHVLMVVVLGYHLQYQMYNSISYQVRTTFLETTLRNENLSIAGKRVGLLNQHPSPYNQVILSSQAVRWTPQANIAYVSTALQSFDIETNEGLLPPPLDYPAGAHFLHDQQLQLWMDFPPDVLIIDNTTKWPLKHLKFDWHQLLSEDARFQEIFSKYELKYKHDDWPVKFEYYVRSN
jgi:hypothetical protein